MQEIAFEQGSRVDAALQGGTPNMHDCIYFRLLDQHISTWQAL
jgi:hypothetical protein